MDIQDCSNLGRWGSDDELGTLNYISPQVRINAAQLVTVGRTVSLAAPVNTVANAVDGRPAWHVMHLETERPYATADSLHVQIHGLANTHLDALGHMFLDGIGYNGRRFSDVVTMQGLQSLDISQMRTGIFTRGVVLDIAGAAAKRWLDPGEHVTPELLEAAEQRSRTRVRSGDAIFVHVGLELREAEQGPEDPAKRAGLSGESIAWLHEREVAVFSGDCIERFPLEPLGTAEMPLHQIGIARMGLVLLDCPSITELLETCRELDRYEFLLTAAPLVILGGTGSPINPIAVF